MTFEQLTFHPIADGYEFHFFLDGHTYQNYPIVRFALNDPHVDLFYRLLNPLGNLVAEHQDWYLEQYVDALIPYTQGTISDSDLMRLIDPIIQGHPNTGGTLVPSLRRVLKFEHGCTWQL